jgi:hypothetical protein
VSENPFAGTDLSEAMAQPGVSSFRAAGMPGIPTSIPVNRTGRFVRVQLSSTEYLSLAEVEVWRAAGAPVPPTSTPEPTATATPAGGEVNHALGKAALQSSAIEGAAAGRAVDGVTDGRWSAGSVTHTGFDAQAWWEVDLGAGVDVDTIDVWPRTDCCTDRLSAFHVLVSDTPFASTDLSAALAQAGVSSHFITGPAAQPTTVVVNRTARHVRVQLSGQNYLSLAEVQVWGPAPAPAMAPRPWWAFWGR